MSNPHKCAFCDGSGYKDTGVGGLQPCLCQWKPVMTTTPKDLADAPEMPEPAGIAVGFRASFRTGDFTAAQLAARDQQWQAKLDALQASYKSVEEDAFRLQGELIRAKAENEKLRYETARTRPQVDNAVALLTGIHSLLYPAPITTADGRTLVFRPKEPDPHQVLQELSDRIRALPEKLAAMAQKGAGNG